MPFQSSATKNSADTVLQNHLIEMETKKSSQPTWETIRYMVAQIQYGGRITDDVDQLLMNTYADKFFNQV